MRDILKHSVGFGGVAAAVLTLGATAASALPDLVINTNDTYVQAGGCSKEEPLATGRIAIKNQGEDAAEVNVAERLTRSMLVIYVPENIDMIDKRPERSKLQPFDQQGISFELARGITKRGRNFATPGTTTYASTSSSLAVYETDADRVRSIQQGLLEIGFDPQGVDGQMGSRTRTAIRDYQASLGEARTGVLTLAQERKLYEKSGVSGDASTSFGGARGETKVRVYVSVDPYNLVEESNESNNLWSFTVTVDCN
ncbi:MAG: peptidoglycan-binding domain-containing protein [Filomicrobium sp.]